MLKSLQKYENNYFFKNRYFILAILFISLLRLVIGLNYPVIVNHISPADDILLIKYANLSAHFNNWNHLSLAKDMGYPLFLAIVNYSSLPYRFWLSLLWIISAILVTFGIYKYINKNKYLLTLAFIFIVFSPIAFDSWCGSRIYRNSIMAPSAIIFLSSLFIFINSVIFENNKYKNLLFWGIISGLTFSFNYFIKEDGITTLPIFLACILFSLIILTYQKIKSKKINYKKLATLFILTLLPILIFSITTVAYEEVNMHYFGINEINTRNGGEIGEFWENLLLIEDPNKTSIVWVPSSTIMKAYNASPTLQSRPDLLDNILHSPWANGDLKNNPVGGDLIAWALRDSLNEVNLFENETQANNFFKNVNNDLKNSFENGSLNKSQKIFIASSLDGKNLDDIKTRVIPYFNLGIKECFFYKYLTVGDYPTNATPEELDMTEDILNEKITNIDKNGTLLSGTSFENFSYEFGKLTIVFYQYASSIIVLLSLLSFIGTCAYQIKNRFKDMKINVILLFEIFLLGTFLVQNFAIAWFSVWIDLHAVTLMKYYNAANISFVSLFEVLSICTCFAILNRKNIKIFNKIKSK